MVTGSYVLPGSEYEFLFKIALIGDSSVGKTSMVKRFTEYKFPSHARETIGVDFLTKQLTVDGHKCKLCIWDTAGQERYRSMSTSYFRGLDGALVVYDIAKRSSFESTQMWLKSLGNNAPTGTAIGLIGNKSDKNAFREVSSREARLLAEERGLFFTEASALNGEGIELCFEEITRAVISKRIHEKQRMDVGKKKEFNLNEKRFSHISTSVRARNHNWYGHATNDVLSFTEIYRGWW